VRVYAIESKSPAAVLTARASGVGLGELIVGGLLLLLLLC
jgi:hypothetical protein